jgi:hypothetical protein
VRRISVEHVFVEYVPEQLDPGVVYVSVEHALASHLCCCGCGHEAVTPLGPDDWKLIFDGVSVSLSPSIGNWRLPCRSHYWIERGQVRWVRPVPRPRAVPVGASTDATAVDSPRRGGAAATAAGRARRVVERLRSGKRRTDR